MGSDVRPSGMYVLYDSTPKVHCSITRFIRWLPSQDKIRCIACYSADHAHDIFHSGETLVDHSPFRLAVCLFVCLAQKNKSSFSFFGRPTARTITEHPLVDYHCRYRNPIKTAFGRRTGFWMREEVFVVSDLRICIVFFRPEAL